jgi:ferredoxin
MNGIIKKMFEKSGQKTPLFFEALTGQLPQYLKRKDIINAGENSVFQNGFTGSPMGSLPLLKKLQMVPKGLKLYSQIKKSFILPKISPKRNEILPKELQELEYYLKYLGSGYFGYTEIDQDYIFRERGILFQYVIVISIQMPLDKILQAPSFATMKMIEDTYIKTGCIVNKVTGFLRKKGFGAQAGPGLGGMANYPLLAKKAGLGEFGRSGLLITPPYGPSHRLAVVYTNINNLPIQNENDYSCIREFCRKCGKCIKQCPGKAISEYPVKVNKKLVSFIDYNKCMSCFNANYGCSLCVKVCPFTTKGYAKLKESKIQAITN